MSEHLAHFLSTLTGWLSDAGVPYMVAGSFASTYHGHPRATQNVDLVIDPTRSTLTAFVEALPADRAYVDRHTALSALAQRDMFNVIDLASGWKADFIIRKARPFSRTEFERRIPATWMGIDLFVATPEDVILSKLEWCRMCGGSERQLLDVLGVMRSRRGSLDVEYVERWIDALGVRDLWALVLARDSA